MICKNCHRQFDGVFCPYCGAKADLYEKDEKKSKLSKVKRIILAIAFCFVVLQISFFLDTRPKKLNWNEYLLAEELPEPSIMKGELNSNSETYFSVDLRKYSLKDYRDYKEACINQGYVIDVQEEDSSYVAFNDEGYKLQLSYYDYDEELSIMLKAPIKLTDFVWPINHLTNEIPVPNVSKGNIEYDFAEYMDVYVQMSKDEYISYTTQCYNAGFSVDYIKSNHYFNAKNKNGTSLRISYEGNDVVLISIEKAPSH